MLSIDIGTTNIKLSLIDISIEDYRIDFIESLNVEQKTIASGMAVDGHDPRLIISVVESSIAHMVKAYGTPDALVLATYLFGLVLLSRSKGFLTNIFTWTDERFTEVLSETRAHGTELYRRTGCPPIHIYALPKILWLKKHRGDVIREADLFLDLKSILTNHLLGRPITDMSSASGTYQLFNIHSLKWDDYALSIAGIDEAKLPETVEAEYTEYISLNSLTKVRTGEKIPLVIGLFDGASMVYGLTSGRSNIAAVNLGTSAMIRTVVEQPIIDDINKMRFQTYYFCRRRWLSGGAINNAGLALDSIIGILASGSEFDRRKLFNELYLYSFDEAPKPITIPLIYSERIPYLRSGVGGSIVGLRAGMRPIDIAASCIEGVVMLLGTIWEALEENRISPDSIRLGGKLSGIPFIKRLFANLFNRTVVSTDVLDVSHVGNALLAVTSLKGAPVKRINEFIDTVIVKSSTAPEDSWVKHYRERYATFKRYLYTLYSTAPSIQP